MCARDHRSALKQMQMNSLKRNSSNILYREGKSCVLRTDVFTLALSVTGRTVCTKVFGMASCPPRARVLNSIQVNKLMVKEKV